jgi:hypothetical protein
VSGVNAPLREHVTSVGFSLTLSKRQIETLVLLHHFDVFDKFHDATRNHALVSNNYCTTARALIRRGLMREHGFGVKTAPCELCDTAVCGHKLTKAGIMTAGLLNEAGLYQEVLDRLGFAAVAA